MAISEPPVRPAGRPATSGRTGARVLGLPAAATALVALWAALLPATRHYGNPDGPAYLVVAERWLAGDLPAALNAYWGPLLSWLAAPLLAVGVPGLLALRLVLLGGALAALPALRALCRAAGASPAATGAVVVAAAPFLAYTALFGLYPDVLLAPVLLWLVVALTRPSFATSRRTAAAVGLLGATAFLAKAYALPVVLVVVPLAAALQALPPRRARPGALARQAGIALAVFALAAGAWVAALSAAYGAPTVSTSAGFNARLVGPTSAGNPFNQPGLFAPPAGAVSAWEEPSRLPIPRRRTADGGAPPETGAVQEVAHRLGNVVANARIVVGSVLRRGAPLVALALIGLAALLRRRRLPAPALAGALVLGAVYAGGLTLIIAIERYTWVPVLALAAPAAVGLDAVLRRRPRWAGPAALVLALAMTAGAVHGLLPRWHAHRPVSEAAEALAASGALRDADVAAAGSWQETHLLCHHLGCRYHGRPLARDAEAAAAELRAAGVTRLVVWRADADAIAGLPAPPSGADPAVYAATADGFALVAARPVGDG